MLDWLNESSEAVQAFATVVLVGVTTIYALLTRSIARGTRELAIETRRTRERATLPMVVAKFAGRRSTEYGQPGVWLNLTNVGAGPALAVHGKWRIFSSPEGILESELTFLRVALRPGEEARELIPVSTDLWEVVHAAPEEGFDFWTSFVDVKAASYGVLSTANGAEIGGTNSDGRFVLGED